MAEYAGFLPSATQRAMAEAQDLQQEIRARESLVAERAAKREQRQAREREVTEP